MTPQSCDALIAAAAGRQAGGGTGRGQGPVRRAGQHRLGPDAGDRPAATSSTAWSGSRPTARPRWWSRQEGGQIAPLLPHRHRQLPPQDGPHLRGLGPAHRRPGRRRRPHRPVQRAHRLQPPDGDYRRLLVAPHGVRSGIIERIDRGDRPRAAGSAGPDRHQGQLLLWTRRSRTRSTGPARPVWTSTSSSAGSATLRPGLPGLSERIRVRSIVGRFLEHSRVLRFGNGGADGAYWIGSADLMHRNLDRRVEALVQVTDPTAQAELARLFDTDMSDGAAGFDLAPDGSWHRRRGTEEQPLIDVQDVLLRRSLGRPE